MQLLIVIVVTLTLAFAQLPGDIKYETYEFEDVLSEEQETNAQYATLQWRSEASGNKTLRIEDKQGVSVIVLTLCPAPINLSRPVIVKVDKLFYSNDGDSDLVQVEMGVGPMMAFSVSFNTTKVTNDCDNWNTIRYMKIGRSVMVPLGPNFIKFSAKTDEYGVELDSIEIFATNQKPEVQLVCTAIIVD